MTDDELLAILNDADVLAPAEGYAAATAHVVALIAERDRLAMSLEEEQELHGEAKAERDRLRVIVDMARMVLVGIDFERTAGGVLESIPINRLADLKRALDQLDGSGVMGGWHCRCGTRYAEDLAACPDCGAARIEVIDEGVEIRDVVLQKRLAEAERDRLRDELAGVGDMLDAHQEVSNALGDVFDGSLVEGVRRVRAERDRLRAAMERAVNIFFYGAAPSPSRVATMGYELRAALDGTGVMGGPFTRSPATALQPGMSTHFENRPPADTLRAIATWAGHAADAIESDEPATHWIALMWAAITLGHPDAREHLKAGLDKAQRVIGPWSADKMLTAGILAELGDVAAHQDEDNDG